MSAGTPTPTPVNLDYHCAEHARKVLQQPGISRTAAEPLSMRAAAVLARQGPYAMAVYLDSVVGDRKANREPDPNAIAILTCASAVLAVVSPPVDCGLSTTPDHRKPGKQLQATLGAIAKNLDKLLLARQVLGLYLNYIRYHAKAGE